MDYRDFTFDRLTKDFGVAICGERDMFANAPPVEASPWLVESLKRADNVGFGSEKSRSERLVSPILMELSSRNQDASAIISGANLDIDPGHALNVECDFILSLMRLQDLVRAPIFCITEAKKQDLDLGVARYAAQLLGAARLNEREKKLSRHCMVAARQAWNGGFCVSMPTRSCRTMPVTLPATCRNYWGCCNR